MTTIRVHHDIGDLADDMASIPVKLHREGERVVAKAARRANHTTALLAKRTAGAHGKHYWKAFTAERTGVLQWEYGADAALPQGGMASGFNFGSRNQPPHLDYEHGLDLERPKWHKDVSDLVDDLFW